MRRSELVMVPSVSPQVDAGSSTSANGAVSVSAKASCSTTHSAACSASCTRFWSGSDCAGLVQAIQTALISPRLTASNSSTAVLPGAPQPRDFGAILGVVHIAVRRDQIRQSAHLAPAHGIGLTGERERRGAGFADLPGGQMQVDQRGVLVDAATGLVETLAIQRQGRPGGEPARGLHDVACRHAADRRDLFRRVVAHHVAQGLPAFGVRGDGGAVDQLLPQHDVEHRVEQRDIGAGQNGEMQVGINRGIGAARVDHDQFHAGVGLARRLDAAEQDGVRVGRVGTGDEDRAGLVDVVVAAWRRIRAEGGLVAGHGGRHAQARIGVDIVGADQTLGELVEDVVRLGGELAGNVEGDGVGTVFIDDRAECPGDMIERRIPADAFARRRTVGPHLGI